MSWNSGAGRVPPLRVREESDRYRWCSERSVDDVGSTHWSRPEAGFELVHTICDVEFHPEHVWMEAPTDEQMLCPECLSRMWRLVARDLDPGRTD